MAHTLLRIAAASMSLALALPASAQSWPVKPVRIVSETASGSVFDTAIRAILQQVGQQLGQSVLIENRPGGGGVVAMEACARAQPDGYTGCTVATNSFSYNPNLIEKLSYDPERDFKPVADLVSPIDALAISAALPVRSVQELRALAVAKPGELNFGTLGEGSQPDVYRQVLGEAWKTSFAGIPYKGGSNVTALGLMSGEINLSKGSLGSWIGGINAGKIRLLAVSTPRRMPQFPDAQTFDEAKLPHAGEVFMGLAFPAAVPEAIAIRLHDEVQKALADPKVIEAAGNRYMQTKPMTMAQFAAFLKEDREQTGALIRKFKVPRQ